MVKKAAVIYISLVVLFLAVIASVHRWHSNTQGYELDDYSTPAQIQKINLNTATAEQLQMIPGIGPAISERIIVYRDTNGPFTKVEDVLYVKGVGESLLSRLLIYATVGE